MLEEPRIKIYLKLTDACQTNASSKNKIGIAGKISISGLKTTYVPGSFAKRKIFSIKYYY